jgi:hypothetical protein
VLIGKNPTGDQAGVKFDRDQGRQDRSLARIEDSTAATAVKGRRLHNRDDWPSWIERSLSIIGTTGRLGTLLIVANHEARHQRPPTHLQPQHHPLR